MSAAQRLVTTGSQELAKIPTTLPVPPSGGELLKSSIPQSTIAQGLTQQPGPLENLLTSSAYQKSVPTEGSIYDYLAFLRNAK